MARSVQPRQAEALAQERGHLVLVGRLAVHADDRLGAELGDRMRQPIQARRIKLRSAAARLFFLCWMMASA